MRPESYFAAGRRLRYYAAQIERYAAPASPRERAILTRAIHGASLYSRDLSARHRRER